jgi:hypothetical protein
MKTHTTQSTRSQIAVINQYGTHFDVVRGINGTEILGRFTDYNAACDLCEKHNVALAEALNLYGHKSI